MVPERTPFPEVTQFLFWLTSDRGFRLGSLSNIWNLQLAVVMAVTWLASVFCLLWHSKKPLILMRRWIVLSMAGWILVTLWIGMVLFGNWVPFYVLGIELRKDPWWAEATWMHLVGVLWCIAVGLIVYRVWRRDSRPAD